MRTIYFDMDGTIADFYGIDGWLEYLKNEDTTPYAQAKGLVNLNTLARVLNRLQKKGYRIAVISWLSKTGTPEYNKAVTATKEKWLKKHLTSVAFDEINIVKYGTPKQNFIKSKNDILFDDEEQNRNNWTGIAYDVHNIIEILKGLN
jgi:hypothetical protein